MQEGLGCGLESEAFARGKVVHKKDVLELLVRQLVDVDLSRQISS